MRKMMCKKLVVSGFAAIVMSYFAEATEVEVGGRMWNHDGGIIYGVTPCDGEVAIPATIGGVKITAIGAEAFRSETNLVSIVIPAGVVSIGMRAFQNCPNLRNVSIPSSVTLIDHWAFAQCVKLANLTLPEGLETIATSAFWQCSSLGKVVVPDSVTQLGYAVFAECDAAEIIFGRGLTDIVKCNGVIVSSKRYAKSMYFNCAPPAQWDTFWASIKEKPVIGWAREYDVAWRVAVGMGSETKVCVLSSSMRDNDPTVMDVEYVILSTYATADVRALAFEDGERSFWKVVRATTFTKDEDGNDTSCNIGDGIAANVVHKLAWKVSTDWKTDLAKVKFEVICSDAAQLPLKLQTIPATAKNPAITIGYNSQTDADIFNALLWYYADGADDITNTDGYVDLDHPYANQVDTTNIRIVNRTSIANRPEALRYIYQKMGYEPLEGGNLMNYVRKATRKDLWFNSGTQTCMIKTSTKPVNLYIGEKVYCVIDVSAGPDATSYPVTYLDTEPVEGWSDEYKTTKILLRRCEAGKYSMQKNKSVTLTKPFYMGVFTITQKQYMQVMGTNPTQSDHQGDLRPVEISWNAIRGDSTTYNWPTVTTVDPSTFVGKIQAKTGLNFDLPTEAQWEYACRAGTSSNYGNGGDGDNDLRLMGHSWSDTAVNVGLYLPNFWGLYDMHGNIGQWCLDYSDGYNTDPAIDYVGSESGSSRVIRGYEYSCWSWYCEAISFYRCWDSPSINRRNDLHNGFYTYLGFRLACIQE